MSKLLLIHAKELLTCGGSKPKRGKDLLDVGLINDGAIYIEDGIIKEVGTTKEVLSNLNNLKNLSDINTIDCKEKVVMPGFVDSHTHFIFSGDRSEEFAMRLKGVEYMEIMKMGGGINATVVPTRNATNEELYKVGIERLNKMLENGITTVEGKSGYGLDLDTEIKQLKVMEELNNNHPIDIIETFMGAHAVPPEWNGDTKGYIDFMINEVMKKIKDGTKAEFCDVFCEKGVFDIEETTLILDKAKELGFKLKLHADEIVNIGGAQLAQKLGATSADHLLKISDEGVKALADSKTIATLLPLTAFSLKEDFAPARKLIDNGCAVALATDLNPGSCFSGSIPLMISLATIYMKMSIEEAINALTINGACAIGKENEIGSLEKNKKGDVIISDCPSYNYLSYNFAMNHVEKVIKKGNIVWSLDKALINRKDEN